MQKTVFRNWWETEKNLSLCVELHAKMLIGCKTMKLKVLMDVVKAAAWEEQCKKPQVSLKDVKANVEKLDTVRDETRVNFLLRFEIHFRQEGNNGEAGALEGFVVWYCRSRGWMAPVVTCLIEKSKTWFTSSRFMQKGIQRCYICP